MSFQICPFNEFQIWILKEYVIFLLNAMACFSFLGDLEYLIVLFEILYFHIVLLRAFFDANHRSHSLQSSPEARICCGDCCCAVRIGMGHFRF